MDRSDIFKQKAVALFLNTTEIELSDYLRNNNFEKNTFSGWIRAEYKRVNDLLTDARDAKNNCLDIIHQKDIKLDAQQSRIDTYQRILNTLGENAIYNDESLINHFEQDKKIAILIAGLNKSNCCIFTSITGKWQVEYMDLESMIFTVIATGYDFKETLQRASEKDWKPVAVDEEKSYKSIMTELEDSNARFEQQVSDLTAEKLTLQNENEELKNKVNDYSLRYQTTVFNLSQENKRLIRDNEGLHLLIDKQDDKQRDTELIEHCQAVIDAGNDLQIYLDGVE
ncbi:MAG: hypothetical protein WC748_09890 [Legionellales bacterium]|jgi:hypothetical protein